MDIFNTIITMSPLLVVLVILLFFRRVDCPDCRAAMPFFVSPLRKSKRMWLHGGRICARCACETDDIGQKLTTGTPVPPFPTRPFMLAAVSCAVAFGLLFGITVLGQQSVPSQPIAASPQLQVGTLVIPSN